MARYTLLFLHPGHFHAALTLRQSDARVNDRIWVYGEDDPDLARFLALVRAFNSRADQPTRWQPEVQTGPQALERLIAERQGGAVILAGRNDRRAEFIARLHAAGFAVLADKPLLLGRNELGLLRDALAGPPLLMDIMTERFDTSWEITQRLLREPALFGEWDLSGNAPAIAIDNVHQIHKTVNGQVLRRPDWFFDIRTQGDGIMDIPSHLVDIVQWLLGPPAFDRARDVVLESARLWPTPIALPDFQRITGMPAWPPALAPLVRGGVLPLACNGELAYRLRGVAVRLRSTWALTEAPSEDTYRVELRGTRARIVMAHAMAREAGRRIAVHPRTDFPGVSAAAERAVQRMQDEFPGTNAQNEDDGMTITVPGEHERSHEELFGRVLNRFLDGLDRGVWWEDEARNLLCKYTLQAEASARAQNLRNA